MKRLLAGVFVAGAITIGMALPAGATYTCPPPPPATDCTPGWGGQGGPKAGFAAAQGQGIPGDGAGDQNHTHCGPPGLAKKV